MSPRLRVFAGLAQLLAVGAQHGADNIPLLRILKSDRTPHPRLGQALANDIALTNKQQYTYVVPACIGGQSLDMIFDTGSSDLWTACKCQDDDCRGVPQFSRDRSSTLESTSTPFKLSYLSGDVEGTVGRDDVTMGPWLVKGQSFAMVDRTVDLGLSSTSTSGILGFCFPSVAAIPTNVGQTLLASLMSLFPPPLQCFAFWLSRDANRAGSLTIGTLDFTLVPNPALIANFSVVRTGHEFDYWKLPLLHLTINGKLFTLSSSRIPGCANPIAVFDTGTTLILGPSADVKALYATLGSAARYDSVIGYQVLCKYAVIIGFVFGFPAREFRLHPADVAWAEGGMEDEWCTGGIQANDNVNSGDWLLGDCFLRNVYAIHYYSPPSIGLLSMTTFPQAMNEFRAERGDDDSDLVSTYAVDGSDRWATATGYVKRWEQPPSGTAARVFGAVAGGFGFVVGGIGAASWRFWRGV